MAVTDKKITKTAYAAHHEITFPVPTTATTQTGLLAGAWTPGFAGKITKVTVFATAVTATITVDVQIGGTTVLTGSITPTAGNEVAGTLSSTLSAVRFSSSQQIQVKYTSNGTGAATNLSVHVQVRPYPMNEDSAV